MLRYHESSDASLPCQLLIAMLVFGTGTMLDVKRVHMLLDHAAT